MVLWFTPTHTPLSTLTNLVIYIESVGEMETGNHNDGDDDDAGSIGKGYVVNTTFNRETRTTSRFSLPPPPTTTTTPDGQPLYLHNYYKFTIAIPLRGSNPLLTTPQQWDPQIGSLGQLTLYSGDPALPLDAYKTIQHHLPIERWLLDAQRSFGHGVDKQCGFNPLWCLPYANPSSWDLVTKSTTTPSFQLNWVGLIGSNAEYVIDQDGRNKPLQIVTQVTIHVVGGYQFGWDDDVQPQPQPPSQQQSSSLSSSLSATPSTSGLPPIQLSCGKDVHCIATDLKFTKNAFSFNIALTDGGNGNHTGGQDGEEMMMMESQDDPQPTPTPTPTPTPSTPQISTISFSFPTVSYIKANYTTITPTPSPSTSTLSSSQTLNENDDASDDGHSFQFLDPSDDDDDDDLNSATTTNNNTPPQPTPPTTASTTPPPSSDLPTSIHLTTHITTAWSPTFIPPHNFTTTLSPLTLALSFPHNGKLHTIPSALGVTPPQPKSTNFWFWVIIASSTLLAILLIIILWRSIISAAKRDEAHTLALIEDAREETRQTTTQQLLSQVGSFVSNLGKALDPYEPPQYRELHGGENGELPEYDVELETGGVALVVSGGEGSLNNNNNNGSSSSATIYNHHGSGSTNVKVIGGSNTDDLSASFAILHPSDNASTTDVSSRLGTSSAMYASTQYSGSSAYHSSVQSAVLPRSFEDRGGGGGGSNSNNNNNNNHDDILVSYDNLFPNHRQGEVKFTTKVNHGGKDDENGGDDQNGGDNADQPNTTTTTTTTTTATTTTTPTSND